MLVAGILAGCAGLVNEGGVVLQAADGQSQFVEDGAHPHRVAAGQIVVDGDYVDALPGKGV